MKHRVALALLLLTLEACLPVDDMGGYWSKAGKDPGLAGSWRVVGGGSGNQGLVRQFLQAGDSYELANLNAQGQPVRVDPRPLAIRTMQVGRYKLLVFAAVNPAGKREGIIIGYKLDGDVLEMYDLFGPSWREFAQQRYPTAANMKKNRGEGDYLRILTFDDQVARMISEVPDTDEFWALFERLVRIR